MKRKPNTVRAEISHARRRWVDITDTRLAELRNLVSRYHLSTALGDLLYFETGWYVTHSGLLRLAHRRHCRGIKTILEKRFSDAGAGRWVFKAIVYNSALSKGFVGYGDADPSNVSSLVQGAEMRVAETRAVNRALRKAYGIGLCSVEELGWAPRANTPGPHDQHKASTNEKNRQDNGQPRLRDRLCLLIRQHQLDAGLVKAYAADYCGTATLRDASREQVEAFINKLAESAATDRDALICHLKNYARQPEANL